MNRKKLIITADDFGYSLGRNKAILECYNRRVISRSSLLVNSVQVMDAVNKAIRYQIPLGLHLNLTEGYPISDPSTVRSLIDPDTKTMLGKMGFRHALIKGKIEMEQVAKEIKAQMKKFIQLTRRKPVFVDGHQHIHILPGICEVFARNILITETRLPCEHSVHSCDWMEEKQKQFFETVLDNCSYAVEVFSENSVSHPNGFVGLSTMGNNMTFHRITSLISTAFHLKNNAQQEEQGDANFVCEVMVHPGYTSDIGGRRNSESLCVNVASNRDYQAGCGKGPDSFELSKEREHELSVLCSDNFTHWLKSENFILCESVNC